ncbi:alpha-amylase [Flavobacteriaceae bacterium UJ101]|nr:alpha-amylase [Flavobacteriaceae bacterium UJ101]
MRDQIVYIMRKIILSILLGVIVIACKANKTQLEREHAGESKENPVLQDLASLIQLGTEETTVNLSDYFIEGSKAKIIRLPEGLKLIKNDSGIITFSGKMNNSIDYVSVEFDQQHYDIPVRNTSRIPYTFSFTPDKKYKKLQVKGSFNGWDVNANPLVLKDGKYQFTVMLNPGNYQYCFVEGDKEFIDPTNPKKVSNGVGGYNSTFSVGDLDAIKPFITTVGNQKKWKIIADQEVNFLAFYNNQFISLSKGKELQGKVPQEAEEATRSFIRVYAYNNKSGVANDILIPLHKGIPIEKVDELPRTDKRKYIMYSLMIDRFKDADPSNNFQVGEPEVKPEADFQGGDLKGITEKVKEGFFTNLGVNTIWLSPVVQNPDEGYGLLDTDYIKTKFSGYHGYWPVSSSKIDPRFGTEEDFKELIEEAHKRNINILVDYVANHVHLNHPVLKEHPDWITKAKLPDGTDNIRKFDAQRFTTWFDKHIPSLDFSKPEVVDQMTDSAVYWFKNYEIDGFRHDATKHIQNEFWRTLTKKLKEQVILPENRSIYQIGETYGSHEMVNSYVNNGMLDAQFEFSLYHHLSNSVTNPKISMKDLKIALEENLFYYGSHNIMGTISGNHDKIRITSMGDGSFADGEDTHKTAWIKKTLNKNPLGFKKTGIVMAFNLTAPGVPVIYQGDEFGMPGADDPDNRRMMEFDIANGSDQRPWVISERKELLEKTKKLTHLRENNMALIYGDTKILYADQNVLVFMRHYMDNTVITALNAGESTEKVSITLPQTKSYRKLKTNFGQGFKINENQLELILKGNSFEILTDNKK